MLRQYFEQFGAVDDAVVMYDHDNKRPRGFGFITFAEDESVDKVFAHPMGAMQNIHDKQIEIKPAVPRDQMPPQARRGPPFFAGGRGMPGMPSTAMPGFGPAANRVPPFGFRGPLPQPGQFGPGPRTPGAMPYLQATPSPRNLGANIGAGYGGSPHARGPSYAPGMQAQLQYGQQPQPQQQPQRFSAAGMAGGGGRFGGIQGQQQFGGMYGSLGFGGGDAGLIQQNPNPSGMGMYNIGGPLQQLQPAQQLQTAQQQGGINGYPGQLDMSKLTGPLGGTNAQGAAAAAAAAMAKAQYGVQPGLGAGGFPGFATGGQQDYAAQAQQGAYAASDPAAAAAAAAAAGYGAEAVAHMQGTSPLGTTPEFASFAGSAGPWGS